MEQVRQLVMLAAGAATLQERVAAYGRLVERFRDMACGYAYSILGDFHLAEDAAQEAFLTAFAKIGQLERPEAFAGWFRRVVWTACHRITRRNVVPAGPLEAAASVAASTPPPHEAAEREEFTRQVQAAILGLPSAEREVTALFYINGYSQGDIADFLEVPVGTVKSRLGASRARLKERMLNMVKDTLHHNVPGEGFNRSVIEELLSRPRPLEMPEHPVRQVWDAIRAALPDYEVIEGEEIVDRDTQETVGGGVGYVCPEGGKVLRTSTTVAMIRAMAGRTPPVRLLTAGRVFRTIGGARVGRTDSGCGEDATHLKVFHQADALCIDESANRQAMQETMIRVAKAALEAADIEFQWKDQKYPLCVEAMDLLAKLRGKWTSIAGCGVLSAKTLSEAGYDPKRVSGFGFCLGLERLAMLKYGIDDVRKLWRPPYVP